MLVKHPHFANTLGLAVLYLVLVAVNTLWVSQAQTPVVFDDEQIYKTVAQSLAAGQGPTIGQQLFVWYPPLYSLFLAPVFLIAGDWYTWMLRLNVLAAASLVIPVWLIANRLLSARLAWGCALVSAIMPFQFVYPRLLLSENLAQPLFIWACWLALLDSSKGVWRHAALGAVLGLFWLARYQSVVVLPFMMLLWWLQPWLLGKWHRRDLLQRRHLAAMALMAGMVVIVYGPWPFFAAGQGNPIAWAFGAVAAANQAANAVGLTPGSAFWPWMIFHAATLCLMCAPYLFLAAIGGWLLRHPGHFQRLALYSTALMVGTTLIFTTMAALYFWRFFGPLWEQAYISERYFMYAVPLMPIAACLVLQQFNNLSPAIQRRLVPVTLLASLAVLVAAYIIMTHATQDLRPPLYISHQAAYSFAFYRNVPIPAAYLAACGAALLAQAAALYWRPRLTFSVTLASLLVLYTINSVTSARDLDGSQSIAGHAKQVALLIINTPTLVQNGPIPVAFDPSIPITGYTANATFGFWGIPPGIAVFSDSALPSGSLYVTGNAQPDSLMTYQLWGQVYYIQQK